MKNGLGVSNASSLELNVASQKPSFLWQMPRTFTQLERQGWAHGTVAIIRSHNKNGDHSIYSKQER